MKRFLKAWTAMALILAMMMGMMSFAAADDNVVTIRIWSYGEAKTEDMAEISAAISELTREKIGANVELYRVGEGSEMTLALTAGEAIDLVNYHTVGTLTAVVAAGYLMPLDDLLAEYGQDILGVVREDYLEACYVDGELFALPCLKNLARSVGFGTRKVILDELGIDPSTIKTFDDMHEVLLKVKEAYPDIYPVVSSWSSGGMQDPLPVDPLGGSFGVLENCFTDSTTVVNIVETDSYREFCEMMYQWNQEGLIMPDVTTSTENNLLGTVGFASFEYTRPGRQNMLEQFNNVDIEMITITPTHTYTQMICDDSWGIPVSAKNPEKAMELLSLMYTDPEIATLFACGLEGKHWEWTDDSKTAIRQLEGLAGGGTGYAFVDWCWPNPRITPVWKGQAADHYEQLAAYGDDAVRSPAMGFQFDNTMVMNEIAACETVKSKYDTALRWGVLNPDEVLDQYINELKAAGVDTIIAEKQAQLDAYLSTK